MRKLTLLAAALLIFCAIPFEASAAELPSDDPAVKTLAAERGGFTIGSSEGTYEASGGSKTGLIVPLSELLAELLDCPVAPVLLGSDTETRNALKNHVIDFAVGMPPGGGFTETHPIAERSPSLFTGGGSVVIYSSELALEPVIEAVNRYIETGGIEIFSSWYMEAEKEFARYTLSTLYTPEEQAWLDALAESGGTVSVALESDNYPVSFYNEQDDEFQGIAVEVLSQIDDLLPVDFTVATTKDSTWNEIIGELELGKVSVVSQLLFSEARRNRFLFGEPYATSQYALISKADTPTLERYQVVGSRVGTVLGTAYEDMYFEWFPDNRNSTPYDTHDQGLDALERGEIDLLMGSRYMMLMQMNYREKPG
ncbi:MAG: transporter substrate-binding domain-containing protein, partial [Oscillospiraceae bacterium]|nr:transporter substrate-binding domain-containing protein [Oscillospiraceae bacterium]